MSIHDEMFKGFCSSVDNEHDDGFGSSNGGQTMKRSELKGELRGRENRKNILQKHTGDRVYNYHLKKNGYNLPCIVSPQKVQIVNEVNKDFVIEALRSIAELLTYGDQHDPSFFDFFMEKQVMGEFEEVVSFPLYLEAIRFAFHEESMVRTAVLWMNRNPCSELVSAILATVDEIEDNLYHFSDVISAGIPVVGSSITDNILRLLILPLLFPALQIDTDGIGAITSLYLLCCILRIVKIKDLANTIAAALLYPLESLAANSEAKINGYVSGSNCANENEEPYSDSVTPVNPGHLRVDIPDEASSSHVHPEGIIAERSFPCLHFSLREILLSYITDGDDARALGSLNVLATLLQTKELDESMLDDGLMVHNDKHYFNAPQWSLIMSDMHGKQSQQALGGEGSGEEQLFSFEIGSPRDNVSTEPDGYLKKLKEQYGVSTVGAGASPRIHRNQVLDALVKLLCRSNISTEILWDAGWLLRQLLPYGEAEFKTHHLKLLKDSYRNCRSALLLETKGIWVDLLITFIVAIEASSPRKEPKGILLPFQKLNSEDIPSESSFAAGERMCELVKVFVLLHQLQIFSLGRTLPEQLPIHPPVDIPETSRAKTVGLDVSGLKPGTEIRLVHALPCRIAFERVKERHFHFLAVSVGTLGWVVLAEELPLKQNYGIVRVAAPLAGTNPRIDDKHSRWLHLRLRIRPSTLPFLESSKPGMPRETRTKFLVDGRWTLAFRADESCKTAFSMILEEIELHSTEVERIPRPVLDLER
ncbi:Detected protein of unknown function [Hibiscus syriacus]|uniref:FPL domain-containing protein n=1 Tax=Hibiscus syriacus TaxID=106335 RepID=A0A6A2YGB1_HIBSY|nr:Detected protein of unknown function [Hibiscus syriacus]